MRCFVILLVVMLSVADAASVGFLQPYNMPSQQKKSSRIDISPVSLTRVDFLHLDQTDDGSPDDTKRGGSVERSWTDKDDVERERLQSPFISLASSVSSRTTGDGQTVACY